jgi:hypothetical protein
MYMDSAMVSWTPRAVGLEVRSSSTAHLFSLLGAAHRRVCTEGAERRESERGERETDRQRGKGQIVHS